MAKQVVVVGSMNTDIVVSVPERATAGSTVLATDVARGFGGKGANQAAASARAGAPTVFIAAAGDDADGSAHLAELERDGVDVSRVATLAGSVTGLALIELTPDGENSITVAPGANGELTAALAHAALDDTDPALVVLQTELARETIDGVARWCQDRGVRLILNDGPVVPLAAKTLAAAHPLVVNEHEALELLHDPQGDPEAKLAHAVAQATGATSVVVSRGASGSEVWDGNQAFAVPADRASRVVDTTGAGDTYLGTLAAALATGADLRAAVREATAAAAVSVTWLGARPPR